MKVLAIAHQSEFCGGANRSFLSVLLHLKNDYHYELLVLVPGEGAFSKKLKENEIRYMSASYQQTSYVCMGDVFDPYRFFKSTLACFKNNRLARKLCKIVQAENFDVIYMNDSTNSIGYYLAQMLDLPYVWHFRSYHFSIKKYMLFENKLRTDSKGKCVCISNAMREYMHKVRGIEDHKLVVIHNGVDNLGVTIEQPWADNLTNGFHCIQCGHLSIAKGQVDSIKAIAELKKRGIQDIYLHIAGTPAVQHGKSYKDFLDELVKECDVKENVIFEGEVSKLHELRKHMQLELMCSVCEPFGRVTVEAMQMGLPVVGSNTGGTLDIIVDGYNGLLYKQGNYHDLADKIERIYLNHDFGNALSENCLKFSKTHFTMDGNVKEIEEVLRGCAIKGTKC